MRSFMRSSLRALRRSPWLLLVILGSAMGAQALNPSKALTQYVRQAWTTSNGLPLAAILTMAQTRDGYLWVGTHEGLARFDGVSFTVFNRRNTPILTNNRVTALCEDPSGALWIGTGGDRFFSGGAVRGGGLLRYDQGQWRRFSTDNGLADDIINALAVEASGKLWIGTTGGLVAFDGQRFTRYTVADGLADERIVALTLDRQGTLWIGTRNGLSRLDQGRIETVGLRGQVVQALYEDQSGRLWAGAQTRLFCRRDPAEDFLPSDVHGSIGDIREDLDSNLWVTSYSNGLARIRGDAIERFAPPPHPGVDVVPFGVHEQALCLLIGRERELWVGTGRGLYCFHDGAVTPIGEAEGLAGRYAYPILRGRDGAIWVGTGDGGLSRIEKGKVVATWDRRRGLPAEDVLALREDRAGALWIGSSAGLTRKTGDRFRTYGVAQGLAGAPVRVIHEEPDGSLLVGAGTTLCRFADGKFARLGPADGYPVSDAQVLAIARDRDGDLWIGTNRGLTRRRGSAFTLFTLADGLPNLNVKCFYQAPDGTLWIGTAGGLARFANDRFATLTASHGLFDDNLHAIFADAQHRFWMSSNLGIFCVPVEELVACADGRRATVSCQAFSVRDGMRDNECNGSRQPAGCQADDASLWFPTANGVAVIRPDQLPRNAVPPLTRIERLAADGQPSATLSATFPAHTQTVEIRYTGLSFLAPDQVVFAYQLVGLSEAWQDAGPRRTAHFTGLPPGTYVFRVRAFNNQGVPSAAFAEARFVIPAPWHRTRLAYAAYALIALGLVAGGVRWRLAALRRVALRLEQTVAARTSEIRRQQDELRRQRDEIETKNEEILDGLRYAKRIQEALLPGERELAAALGKAFVIYAPRDIVSGDFYWARELDPATTLLAVGDCTGHGVPGALMSVIGITLLEQIVQEGAIEPAAILERLHLGIRQALHQADDAQTAQDGLDIGICRIERAGARIKFSGAGFRLYLVAPTGEVTAIKGDAKAVGGRQREACRSFTQHEIGYAAGAMLYLATDGLTDQKGAAGKRFGSRRVAALFQRVARAPATEQAQLILQEMTAFRAGEAQLDDITVVGARLARRG